jgi:hypothetical protein
MDMDSRPGTGFSPSVTSCSKELRTAPYPKMPLQITTRTPKTPDFKFELLPLHSQLLRQSLLVSFPPLIDMLKFSGYPYLIRGQPEKIGGLRRDHPNAQAKDKSYYARAHEAICHCISKGRPTSGLFFQYQAKELEEVLMTLEQACLPEYQEAQCAFKDSMIH